MLVSKYVPQSNLERQPPQKKKKTLNINIERERIK